MSDVCPYQAVEGDLVVVLAKGLFSSASGKFPYHRPVWKPEAKLQVPSAPQEPLHSASSYSRPLSPPWPSPPPPDKLLGLSSLSDQAVSTWYTHDMETPEAIVHRISTD